jgi:type I restriction-modification system DNA methylase subunit
MAELGAHQISKTVEPACILTILKRQTNYFSIKYMWIDAEMFFLRRKLKTSSVRRRQADL